MIAVAFLCAALALPAQPTKEWVKQLKGILAAYPAQEIYLMGGKWRPDGKGWHKTPWDIGGFIVWVREQKGAA